MRDFKDEVQINKNVVGDLDIRLRVEESEQQTKKQTDNFRIQNNLNQSNDVQLLGDSKLNEDIGSEGNEPRGRKLRQKYPNVPELENIQEEKSLNNTMNSLNRTLKEVNKDLTCTEVKNNDMQSSLNNSKLQSSQQQRTPMEAPVQTNPSTNVKPKVNLSNINMSNQTNDSLESFAMSKIQSENNKSNNINSNYRLSGYKASDDKPKNTNKFNN